MQSYRQPSKEHWSGRHDAAFPLRIHEAIKLIDITDKSLNIDEGGIGFLGFSSDEGIRRNLGRPGAAEGPNALRAALANLPLPSLRSSYADCGTIFCQNNALDEAQRQLAFSVQHLLDQSIFPIVLGGGHEMAWGHFQGIAATHPNRKVTLINFDAHFDLRPVLEGGKGTSGTSFTQIADYCHQKHRPFEYACLGVQKMSNTRQIFEIAEKMDVKYLLAEKFHLGGPELPLEFLDPIILHSEAIYLTVCLDVFASAFAPGVSAPQALGLLPWHVIPLLERLAASGKVISMDIAELCPPSDIDGRTAHLAAGLVSHFLHCRNDWVDSNPISAR